MDTQAEHYGFNVDTSRPFRSVKEAIAIFGERLLLGENVPIKTTTTTTTTSTTYNTTTPRALTTSSLTLYNNNNNEGEVFNALKKLEFELEETKMELKLLKERETETEVALASLNAELHLNMSKLASVEAAAARNAVDVKTMSFDRGGGGGGGGLDGLRGEESMGRGFSRRRGDSSSTTLSEILSFGANETYFRGEKEKKKNKKMKPIIPLVGDLFFKKKVSLGDNSLYATSDLYF